MSFDRLAPHYRWLETMLAGGLLQRARVQWLAQVPPPRRVLLAGEGPGRFLEAAGRQWPEAHFRVIDSSAVMLDESRRAWLASGGDALRVEWLHLALPSAVVPCDNCDLLAAHFFLDCFSADPLGEVVRSLARAATPEASWLITDFRLAECGWRRWRSRSLLALMYGVFRYWVRLQASSLVCPEPVLKAAGFRLHRRRTFSQGFVQADWWRREVA